MAKSCETCRHCDYDNYYECEIVCDSEYSGWAPPCKTCAKYPGEGVFCGAQGDCWEAKTSETIEEWVARSAKDAPMPGCVLTGSGAQSLKTGTFVFKTTLTDTQKKISEICDEVKTILLEKNRKYGDSALNPKRVFSKASPIEQINVRIDDKISRIMSAQDDDTEDAELDLIGYLILKRVAKSVGEGK